MTWFLRQSTASQEIPLGPFVDDTDGKTAETALTIANTDIKLQKTGATSQASKNSGGATHIATGDYYAVLDATDTDTIGPMRVKVHVAGALPVWLDCVVLDEAVYDALFGTTALSTYAGGDTSGVTTLLSRLTGTRAGLLDNLSNLDASISSVVAAIGIVDDFVDELESRLTSARAGYLDNLSAGAVAQAATALSTAQWTNARATLIDQLAAGAAGKYGSATFNEMVRTIYAVLALKSSGAGSTNPKVLGADGSTIIDATADVDGNVTASTVTP